MSFIAFKNRNDEYGWMGNMVTFPITIDGMTLPSVEHWFMWFRIKESYSHIRGMIKKEKNAFQMKKIIKPIMKNSPEVLAHPLQSSEDVELMERLVGLKLEQHPHLIWELLLTHNMPIYEDVTERCSSKSSSLFWGAAEIGRLDPLIMEDEYLWIGKNWLGNIYQRWRRHYHRDLIVDKTETIRGERVNNQINLKLVWNGEIEVEGVCGEIDGKFKRASQLFDELTGVLVEKIVNFNKNEKDKH